MSVKKVRILGTTFVGLSLICIFYFTQRSLSSENFSLLEFAKGVLTGMTGVATVAWLINLFTDIRKIYKPSDTGITVSGNVIVFRAVMLSCLIGTLFTAIYSYNIFLLTAGTIVMSISLILYIVYLRDRINKKLVGYE
jgi:hypothetical protein